MSRGEYKNLKVFANSASDPNLTCPRNLNFYGPKAPFDARASKPSEFEPKRVSLDVCPLNRRQAKAKGYQAQVVPFAAEPGLWNKSSVNCFAGKSAFVSPSLGLS